MKNMYLVHRTIMVLTTVGGAALLAYAHLSLHSESTGGWLVGLGFALAICVILSLGILISIGNVIGMPQALGGLMILTGLVMLNM